MLRRVKRRTGMLATLGGLLAAAGLLWLAWPQQPPTGDEHRTRAIVLPQPAAVAALPVAAPAVRVAARLPQDAVQELCGTGRMPLRSASATDAFDSLPDPLGRLALQELRERLVHMLAMGDARQRVAAWRLRQPDAADPAAQAAWAAGLLAEAHAGRDAQGLRWASAACSHTEDASRCRRNLALARTQVEPDNGLHWLAWAEQADGDTWQRAAWLGALRAPHWNEHPVGLTAVTQAALAAMRPVPPAYLRSRLARETLGHDAAQPPEGFVWLDEQCARHLGDCAQLAERMAGEADSAALLQQAAALGQQVGWTESRLQALAATTQVFHAQLPGLHEGAGNALACAAVEPQLSHVEAVVRRGELPLTR